MILDQLLRLRDGGSAKTTTEDGVTSLTQGSGAAVVQVAKTPLRGLAVVVVNPVGGVEHASGSQVIATIEASDAKEFTTVDATANAKLTFTSKQKDNPDISITFTEGGVGSLAVAVTGSDIDVTLQGGVDIASAIKAIVEADPAANALVSVSYPAGNDGTGVCAVFTIEQLFDTGLETVATFPNIAASSADAAIAASMIVRRFHTQKQFVRSVITITNTLAIGVNPDIFIGDMIPEED